MPALQPLRLSVVALLAVTLTGAALRMADLGGDSFDPTEIGEINSAETIRLPRDQMWSAFVRLSTWITAATLESGYGERTLRLPSAAAGTLTIVAVWGLGVLSFGAETGLYAAAAIAAAPLHVALSRTVGQDSWLTLFVTLTVLTFTWAVQKPRDGRRQMVCAATALLACSCAYRGLLVLAALALAAVVMATRRPSLRRLARRTCLMVSLVAAAAVVLAVYHPPQSDSAYLRPHFGWMVQLQMLNELATGQPRQWWAGAGLVSGIVSGLISTAGSRSAIICIAWLLVGTEGLFLGEWSKRIAFRPADIGFVLPAYLLLAAAGLTWVRRTLVPDTVRLLAVGGQAAALALLLAVELPELADYFHQHNGSWRAAAQVVAANSRPYEVLVVLAEQPSFAFYAPDLAPRMEPDVRPARAPGYFVHPKRGWLVVPDSLRHLGGWNVMQQHLMRFPPVDLSPDASTVVLYMGQGGYDQLLFEAAHFTLPTATLVRGTLLLDWLQLIGPVPAVLWKVDQIALSREALDFRNPSLLHVVYYLAEHNHAGRAASLAYRLATAQPDWDEAQRALAAFRSAG